MPDYYRNEIKIVKVESLCKLKNYILMIVKNNNNKRTSGEDILIFEFQFYSIYRNGIVMLLSSSIFLGLRQFSCEGRIIHSIPWDETERQPSNQHYLLQRWAFDSALCPLNVAAGISPCKETSLYMFCPSQGQIWECDQDMISRMRYL